MAWTDYPHVFEAMHCPGFQFCPDQACLNGLARAHFVSDQEALVGRLQHLLDRQELMVVEVSTGSLVRKKLVRQGMLKSALGQSGPEFVRAHLRQPGGRFELGDRYQLGRAADEDPSALARNTDDPTDGGRIGLVPDLHVGAQCIHRGITLRLEEFAEVLPVGKAVADFFIYRDRLRLPLLINIPEADW